MKARLSFALLLCAATPSLFAQQAVPRAELAVPAVPRAVPARPAEATVPRAVPVVSSPSASTAAATSPARAVPAVPVRPNAAPATPAVPVAPAIATPALDAELDGVGTRVGRTIIPAPAADLEIAPSFLTQKLARTYTFTIPAPRGQILDRTGLPLAQTRVSYNLAIQFPSPSEFKAPELARYIGQQMALVRSVLKRDLAIDMARVQKHYENRAIMPLVIAVDLPANEVALLKGVNSPGLALIPGYQRVYPQGLTAAHIVGYVGREDPFSIGPVENNELLWPNTKGRSGIERGFNDQLAGKPGVMSVSYDAQGRRSEKVTVPPTPGENVVLALDLRLQRLCEKSIETSKRPGAIVFMDPNNGEILALASWPSFDPNHFIPQISETEYVQLSNDPTHPLLPRAYGSAYPPGSTFKIITGLAAMNEGKVDPDDRFGGEAAIQIGGLTFRNWKKTDVGPLNYVQALTQSCNTYFYKMGLKTGAQPIIDYCLRLGFGSQTGLPIVGESPGNVMTAEYMRKTYGRKIWDGDIANLSIGQGDTLVTPLQLASAMATIGNGGTVFYPRLVLQLQGVDDKISFGYEIRVRDQIEIDKDTMKALREGMIGVVHGAGGTAHSAAIPGFKIAAKTGTAQNGAGKNERVNAWFSGFAPAEKPRYAFAAVFEGKAGDDSIHGGSHAAPMITRVLKEVLKPEPKAPKEKKGGLRVKPKPEPDDEDDDFEEDALRPRVVSPAEEEEVGD